MNNKFQIINTLTFSENNLDDATKLLNQEIDDSMLPSNGELIAMAQKINEIIRKAKKFQKLLIGVKEVDTQRRELIESVNEKKDAN